MSEITVREAAVVLGMTPSGVYTLVRTGTLPRLSAGAAVVLDRDTVEGLALRRVRRAGGHPYFLTSTEAAAVLGVTRNRVHQLADRGFLPFAEHNGRRLFRRPQLEVVANARKARWVDGIKASD